MKEDKFIKDNIDTWRRLETTLKKLQSKSYGKFDNSELDDFVSLYNRACAHLSYSRTNYGNTETTTYLNRLVGSAHALIYSTRTSSLKKLMNFILKEFPSLIAQNAVFLLISSALLLLGIGASFVFTLISPENASAFVPLNILNGVSFEGGADKMWDSPIMSSYILTNNIRVGFMAFALGITLCLGTAYVLVYNGFMVGGLGALAFHSGASLRFWALILPHGILELFAIIVCGAAGIIIGHSIINPGIYSRKDSFILNGKTSIKLVLGTIPIFVAAGLIEGFITPLPTPEVFKFLFALLTLIALWFYLFGTRPLNVLGSQFSKVSGTKG